MIRSARRENGSVCRITRPGPVSWTILSPWQLLWEGRLNLNGLTDQAGTTVAAHLEYVADGLAAEAAHPRPLS